MKNLTLKAFNILLIFCITLVIVSCSSETGPILGTWQEYDEESGETFLLRFDKNNYAHMDSEEEKFGGRKFTLREEGLESLMSMSYEIDYTKEPHWLDLILYIHEVKTVKGLEELSPGDLLRKEVMEKNGKEGLRALGIAEFTEDNKLKVQINFDAWEHADNQYANRPESFNPYLYGIMEKVE